MKCTHNTLTSLLSAWDKLVVVGTNPDNHKSILTKTIMSHPEEYGLNEVKIAIEYRIEDSNHMTAPYIYAFLVKRTPKKRHQEWLMGLSW
jgi:hypothetical protein